MKFLKLFLLLFIVNVQAQQGGMWIPSMLKGMNETEMKNLGMKMSVEDIYAVNQSSIKDAIVHFDGGCTSEIISAQGLMLTNHHCGYDAIQSHSTLTNNYLEDGFWANSFLEELPNPGMTATLIISIHDVTAAITQNILDNATEKEKQNIIQENISKLQKSFAREQWQECKIRSFYEGNQYILFVTETFKDIRLVGTPPSSIGKYGSDTDNWVWPRHTGDFSLFRIYANKDNKPAEYSKDNVPYKPKHFLPISLDGVEEGDFTMVFGFPGRTQEYLPSFAVEQIINTLNPAKIEVRDAALKVQDAFMRKDEAIKIQYASKFASVANYWKKWIGESKGLKKSNAVWLKKQYEEKFTENLVTYNKENEYNNLLKDFEKNYSEINDYALARDYFIEVVLRNTELLSLGFKVYQLEQVFQTKGEQAFNDRKNNFLEDISAFYKDFNVTVDEKVFEQLLEIYINKSPKLSQQIKNIDKQKIKKELYTKSKLRNLSGINEILSGNAKEVLKKLNKDKGYIFIKNLSENYFKNIAPKYEEINIQIAGLQRKYMKAQLEVMKDQRFFPDANSTIRITYGKVKGYSPTDAVYYEHQTTLDGVIEKYIPNDYEFNLPQKLIDLHNSKDYGNYANNKGELPVCFIGTNHTTGGNSGSPALDAYGNLIGLNFDRVWEGTMSDIYYSPDICRNIMVDARYILFIIDKYANCQHIMGELKLVNPKK